MTLDEALDKDRQLKAKFFAVIESQQKLDGPTIMKADVCELGKWLYGEAERKYKFLKSYRPAIDAHAAFHQQAGKVVREINGRGFDDAKALLADNGAYAKSFAALEAAVAALKKDAKL
jgi:methyl-accepting chemotaxis protein